MSRQFPRAQSRDFLKTQDKHLSSFYRMASRTSIIRGNFVHFGEDSIMEDNPKKEPLTNTLRDNQLPRTALRKRTIIRSQAETRTSDTPPDDVFKNLVKMNAVHLPATIRKICSETTRVVTGLLNSPLACNSSVMRELKCLMSSTPSHDSYLLSKALIFRVKERLNELNAQQQYNFGYDAVAALVRRVQERCGNSSQLLGAYQMVVGAHQYPVSVQLMLMYIGVHLHSISSSYDRAQQICRRMLDLLLKLRLDEYLTIYLILMIKLKSNLSEWSVVIALISKALAAAWVYKLDDLQIWCYFEFSRAYFALGNTKACEFFKQRSQMSITEQPTAIYRLMVEQGYRTEIQRMRVHNYYFNLDSTITFQQLTDHAQRQRSSVSLKAQVYAKGIAESFKIKHVKNLIVRLGEDVRGDNKGELAGNPQFLTHESGIKNLNVYFRVKHKRGSQKKLYTFQNSVKNHVILKQMLRNLLVEMKGYVPITVEN